MSRVYKHKQKQADGNWAATAKWYLEFRDHHGRRRSIAGYNEKRVSEDVLRFVEHLVDLRASGAPLESHSRDRVAKLAPRLLRQLIKFDILDGSHSQKLKPVHEHLADYIDNLRDKQRNATYVQDAEGRIKRVLSASGCTSLPLPSPANLQSTLARLREERDLGAQTFNHYLTAFKQFANWLSLEGRMPEVSYASVSRTHVASDLRHPRRALTDDECQKLLRAALNGPVHFRMPGRERATLYLTALATGLRATELRRLKVGDVRDDNNGPYLRVIATRGKNKRELKQPLAREVADELMALAKDRPTDESLFSMPTSHHTAKMVRADLETGGIAYQDADGQFADFHSLRHTFVTRIVRSGADVKVVQQLARHSTPTLTLGRYSHACEKDMREAIAGAPSLTNGLAESQADFRTDRVASGSLPLDLLLSGESIRTSANNRGQSEAGTLLPESPELQSPSAANPNGEGPDGIRTFSGGESALTAFETDAINHSATPPRCLVRSAASPRPQRHMLLSTGHRALCPDKLPRIGNA